MSALGQFILLSFISSVYNVPETTISESEERQKWLDEFEDLQAVTRSKILEDFFSKLEEERARDRTTPDIEIFNRSAESATMKKYFWESIEEAPDYPDEPHIKPGT